MQAGLLVQSLSWLWSIFVGFCLLSFLSVFIFKLLLKSIEWRRVISFKFLLKSIKQLRVILESVPYIRIVLLQFILKPF
jgi:hypothetical protein